MASSACADALDPSRPELYDFLGTFLTDMVGIFSDDYLMLGGDEVDISCYDNSPSIAKWMKDHNMNSSSIQQYFWQQLTAQVHRSVTVSRTPSEQC